MNIQNKTTSTADWYRDSWLNIWMDQKIKERNIKKLLHFYNISQHYYDIIEDLYGEYVYVIYAGITNSTPPPSEYKFLEKLYWKFMNFQDKANRHQNKILRMLREGQNVE
jgi:hypothetical protein